MDTFSNTPVQGKEFTNSFIAMLNADPQMMNWLELGNNELQALVDYIKGINAPNVNQELKDSLVARVEGFEIAIKSAQNLADPNLTDATAVKEKLQHFEDGFNAAIKKGTIFLADNTFAEDVSNLLNNCEHKNVDDPQIQTLWNIVSMASKAEGLADSKHAEMKLNEIDRRITDFNQKKADYENKFSNVVKKMYKISPDLTALELENKVLLAQRNLTVSQGKLDTFMDPVNANARKVKRMEAETQVANRRREIDEANERTKTLREKSEAMENGGSYSFKELAERGAKDFEDFDNIIADDEKAIERLNAELSDTENKKKLLNTAEEKLKAAQDELDRVLEVSNAKKSFNELHSTIDKTNAATQALKFFDALDDSKELMFPALLDNGIITFNTSIPKTVKQPGVTMSRDFIMKKELAEKYVQMRQCILEASDNPQEAQKFFDNAENSIDCAKIMTVIHDRFVNELNEIRLKGLDKQNEMAKSVLLKGVSTISKEVPKEEVKEPEKTGASKFFGNLFGRNKQENKNRVLIENRSEDKLNFMSIENLQDLISARDDAKAELDSLKARLTATRDTKAIKADIDRFNENIKETKEDRLNMTNDFLEHFELENTDKEMSFTDLFRKCENKLRAMKTEVKTAEDFSSQINLVREEAGFRQLLDEVSVDTENRRIKELQNKVNLDKKAFEELSSLKKDYDTLGADYKKLANTQKDLKKDCNDFIKNNDFSHIADELSSVSTHLADAKRLVSHTNTPFFTKMQGTLAQTVTFLNDKNKTREEKIAQLKLLQEDSQTYLTEKSKQIFVTHSAMRNDRIAKATLIKNLATEEIKRQEALINSKNFKDAKKSVGELNLNANMGEIEFSEKFRQFQTAYAQKEKNVARQNQAAPVNNAPEKTQNVLGGR